MKSTPAVHTLPTCHVGVDVGKDTLLLDAGNLFHGAIPNTPAEIAKRLKTLRKKAPLHVSCEATGPYDRPLVNTCRALGLPVSRLNPACVAQYRKSQGILAKTDKQDAHVIRLFAEHTRPAPLPPPDKARDTLRQLHLLRDTLVTQRTALSNLRDTLDLPVARKPLGAALRALDAQIAKLDAQIRQATDAADPVLRGVVEALDGITGIALLTATKLAAHAPELGTLSRRRAASLAGLAPIPDDSGTRNGPRHIRGGRKPVRDALYMAALTATRHDGVLRAQYQGLIARGKHHNLALTAVMRKLFYHANRVVAQYLLSLGLPAAGTPPGATMCGAPAPDA